MAIDDLNPDSIEKLIDVGAAHADAKEVPGYVPYVVVPNEYHVEGLDKYQRNPARLQQTVSVFNTKSFTEYFTDYCNEDSRIFVDVQKPAIVAVLDYHIAGVTPTPNWTMHRLFYQFRETTEWKTWAASNKKAMTQADFAHFIEDNVLEVVQPPAAQMIEIARSLEAKKNVNFSSSIRLSNGEVQLNYEETINATAAKGSLGVPETFELGIKPFEGADSYALTARLRFKFNQGGLVLWYDLVRPHKVIEDAVNTVVAAIEASVNKGTITWGALASF